MDLNKDDVVRVVPLGRKNKRLVRVGSPDYDEGRGIWWGWLCNLRGGWVPFRPEDVIEIVPDPFAEKP